MSRKSNDTDLKLLKSGRKLLIKKGASQLSIREVCEIAKVNLGMFNYHFGSKDDFISLLLGQIYDEFLSDFKLEGDEISIKVLEHQLFVMGSFARDNRHLILVLLNDVLNGEVAVKKFARVKMKKHLMILAKTIKGCQKKGLVKKYPLPLILTQIVGSLGLTNLIPELLKHLGVNKAFGLGLAVVSRNLMTDKAINQRIEIIINGIISKE